MFSSRLSFSIPANFDFWRTVYSHGWSSLPPFQVNKTTEEFVSLLRLSDGALAECAMQPVKNRIAVRLLTRSQLNSRQRSEIRRTLADSLRLHEDFSAFHEEARRHSRYRWIARKGVGRLLRAPTVFEDTVKMMCTTNCSWSLTTIIVQNLIGELGETFSDGRKAFPTPETLAGVSEGFVRKKIRAGYRSPYLIEFAERVAGGTLDVEAWRTTKLSTDELFESVHQIKGVGPYAAGNMLRLLGRYDYLALDSWVRTQYARLRHKGRKVSDRTIERAYSAFGEWRGLFFWLEMTQDWFDGKFPDWS